ncbi:MAG: hypothetical protein WDN44_01355 [Sphingomonas sp.]
MSKKPSVPIVPQSPAPAEVPRGDGAVGEALTVAKELAAARKRWSPSRTQIGIGAAVGVGSAAVVAALLYWRGNRK